MLGATMSLVAEAWKREKELVRLKADAVTVSGTDEEGNQTLTWKRLDAESSQTYLKACGSEVVGVVFAGVSAILNDVPGRKGPDAKLENQHTSRDHHLDQLWRMIEPVLENMIAVRAVDWIKIEAFKILAALMRPATRNEISTDKVDSLLHLGYLEGEVANIDIAPKGREQTLLELAQSLAEKRVQPEDIPSLPSTWIASRFSSKLGRLFRQSFKGLYSVHDGSLVGELLEADPSLPVSRFHFREESPILSNQTRPQCACQEHLVEIWTGMLQAIAQNASGEITRTGSRLTCADMLIRSLSDTASYGQALIEIVAILIDVDEMQPEKYIPAGSLTSVRGRLEKVKLAIWQDLVSILIRELGPETLSTRKLAFPRSVFDNGASDIHLSLATIADIDEGGGTSVAGVLLHRLTSYPPVALASDAELQGLYLENIDQLVRTLESGSVSKRVLGNLTNTFATFHDEVPSIRKALWTTLCEYMRPSPLYLLTN